MRHDWQRTASIMALIANVHRSPSRPAFKPADFDPFSARRRVVAPIEVLRQVFVERRMPR